MTADGGLQAGLFLVRQPAEYPTRERSIVGTDDSERRVFCADDRSRFIHDALEHGPHLELAGNRDRRVADRFEQRVQPALFLVRGGIRDAEREDLCAGV